MKLVMLLLVRDEVDIISQNMQFHLDHGVDAIVAIDNGSTDGTRDVLQDFARSGVATVIDEPGRDYQQSEWVTRAALHARDAMGADWIFSNDADEFWTTPEGDLKAPLARAQADIQVCRRMNMIYPWDTPDDTPWLDRLIYRSITPPSVPTMKDFYTATLPAPYFCLALQPKVLMRAKGLQKISQGNHAAAYEHPAEQENLPVAIFHFPVRTREQLEKKIVQGGQAYGANTKLAPEMGWHWRRWYRMYQEQGIEPVLDDALPSKAKLNTELETGRCMRDDRFQKLIRGH